MFTLKGGDFITNKYPGVGGLDGLSSGIVSSTTAAIQKLHYERSLINNIKIKMCWEGLM